MSREPTYRTEGEITQFDERDTVFSREALIQGSPEETEYHRIHPDKIVIDRKLARFIEKKMESEAEEDQFGRAIYEANFIPPAALALPDMVDGEPARSEMHLSPAEASSMIKALAFRLGADDVRIGPLRQEWIYSHKGSRPFFRGGYSNAPYFRGLPDGYQGASYGGEIRLGHRSAVSLAFRQERDMIATGSTQAVDFEGGRIYALSALVSVAIGRFIRSLGFPARAHHLRNYLVMVVPVAVDAGIGELARCGYAVSRSLGANFRLACVTTDLPLEYDDPVDIGMQDFCDKCSKCAVNCPAQAIPRGGKTLVNGVWKWKLDEEVCLFYWGKTGYSCGICQVVCPWTKTQSLFHRSVATLATNVPQIRRALVMSDDIVYGARFRPKQIPAWLNKSRQE